MASASAAVAAAVSEERLWRRHMEIATIGATGRGGVNRQALTPEDAEARKRVLDWAGARGFTAAVDAIGNMFIRREGSDPGAAPVVTGSHLDTQPTGGNFDGIFGVLAALEVLDAASDAGVPTVRPVEAAVWTNEEGGRFQPTTMGSAVFAGSIPLETALASTDADGVTLESALGDTLSEMGVEERREFRFPMAAYLEAHIEQGPILEETKNTIGVVTGIQGLRWFQIEVTGEEAHAGTTPLGKRKDAVAAAVRMIAALQEWMRDESDVVRFTVGRFDVTPNSPNTVPSRVVFTVDFRHPDSPTLARLGDGIDAICHRNAMSCEVIVKETLSSFPTGFDTIVQNEIRRAATRQGWPCIDMVSGATHDAKFMVDLCPTGMLFVPCEGGVSHSEAERAAPADLAAGASVLAEAVVELANR